MDIQKILSGLVVLIGVVMIVMFQPALPPVFSGVAFILIGISRFLK